MTKAELIAAFAKATGMPSSKAHDSFNALCGIMAQELQKEDGCIALQGIGKIVTKQRAARTGRNPRTGEVLTIPACKVLAIRTNTEFTLKLKV